MDAYVCSCILEYNIFDRGVCLPYAGNLTQQQMVIGICCDFFTILYYGAPLNTMAKVIRERDSSSLFPPLIVVNMVASSMWTVYGAAINNINVFLPNVIGASLAALQLILIVVFYKTKAVKSDGDESVKKVSEEYRVSNLMHDNNLKTKLMPSHTVPVTDQV